MWNFTPPFLADVLQVAGSHFLHTVDAHALTSYQTPRGNGAFVVTRVGYVGTGQATEPYTLALNRAFPGLNLRAQLDQAFPAHLSATQQMPVELPAVSHCQWFSLAKLWSLVHNARLDASRSAIGLLFEDIPVFAGAIRSNGIVVASSGLPSEWDEYLSRLLGAYIEAEVWARVRAVGNDPAQLSLAKALQDLKLLVPIGTST